MPATSAAPPVAVRPQVRPPAAADAWTRWRIPVLVAVIALAVRLSTVLRGGGLFGYYGYDDGVYYAAAASLVAGRLPYRDFVLLHPPGIALALAPFAELGRLTSDRDALAVARAVWLLLGALNVGLTARVAGRLGRAAALVAGTFAAVWVGAVYVDRATLLEPLGTLVLLVSLLLLSRPGRISPRTAEVLAGVALGLGVCVKIWGVVPLAVVGVAVLLGRGWRAGLRLALGAAAAGLAVCGPFLAAAPGPMIRMVALDQTGRPELGPSLVQRPPRILALTSYFGTDHLALLVVLTLVVGLLFVALTLLALREPRGRLWVALLIAHGLVLLAAPVFFTHYDAFLAAPLSLVLGAATAVLARDLRGRAPLGVRRAAAATVAVALAVVGVATATLRFGAPYPGRQLAAFVPEDGCVRADDAGALVQLNVLSRDLRRGCPLPVDFTGLTYDRLARTDATGTHVARRKNTAWQQYATTYLTSGAATVLVRGPGNGFNRATRTRLGALPVLGQVGRWQVLGPPAAQRAGSAAPGSGGTATR